MMMMVMITTTTAGSRVQRQTVRPTTSLLTPFQIDCLLGGGIQPTSGGRIVSATTALVAVMMMTVVIIIVLLCSLFCPVQLVPVHIEKNCENSSQLCSQEAHHHHNEAVAVGVAEQRLFHRVAWAELRTDFRLKYRKIDN